MRCLPTLLFVLTCACSLRSVLPGTAVLKPKARKAFAHPKAAKVTYTGPARTQALFPPMQVFGVQYDVDIVLVSDHPDWEMHEYARLKTPRGNMWIAKDAATGGVQTIVSDADDLHLWLPEIPIRRIQSPISVVDRSKGSDIDLKISYTNTAGAPVEVWTRGNMPNHPPPKRNGNTMGHSKDIVAVVLDLERMGANVQAGMKIDNTPVKLDKILGLMPFKFLLRQTQGGVAISSYKIEEKDSGFTLRRPAEEGEDWPTKSVEAWTQTAQSTQYDNGFCRFDTAYIEGGLARIEVTQHGIKDPIFRLSLSPALPDLRRPFAGVATSRFMMDVGEKSGHGTGEIHARWRSENTLELRMVPSAPDWLVDRPMLTEIVYGIDGTATVRTTRRD